jgi:xanthine/uracil permease
MTTNPEAPKTDLPRARWRRRARRRRIITWASRVVTAFLVAYACFVLPALLVDPALSTGYDYAAYLRTMVFVAAAVAAFLVVTGAMLRRRDR